MKDRSQRINKTLAIVLLTGFLSTLALTGQQLQVSEDHRHLETSDGRPFLWLGDTAWELFHRLDRDEATEYLSTRAEQGFTVIQAVILAELDGLRVPNSYGEVPFVDFDPEKPNEKYFEHVDFIVNKAEASGLTMALLPTWGDKLYSVNPGAGPVVFNVQNAAIYGEFLGTRYRDKPVVWILGGDRNVDSDEVFAIWTAMAEGLRKGDQGKHLISYHPRGPHNSSNWFHNETWFDFNLYQSGHEKRYNEVYRFARKSYLLHPAKPFIDGEPAYEDIPVRFWQYCDWELKLKVPGEVLDDNFLIRDPSHFKEGFFNDHDVRVHAYWNLLSGAAGYTYGNNAVWQMFKKGGDFAIPCLTDWRDALGHPGAQSMRYVHSFFDSYPLCDFHPDSSAVYGINSEDENYVAASVANDRSCIIAYLSLGQSVSIVTRKLEGSALLHRWFNPRTGVYTDSINGINSGIQRFTPPSSGPGNDWVLIIKNQ